MQAAAAMDIDAAAAAAGISGHSQQQQQQQQQQEEEEQEDQQQEEEQRTLLVPLGGHDVSAVVLLPPSELARHEPEEVIHMLCNEAAQIPVWLDVAKGYLAQGQVRARGNSCAPVVVSTSAVTRHSHAGHAGSQRLVR
jgi:hypothetical protein